MADKSADMAPAAVGADAVAAADAAVAWEYRQQRTLIHATDTTTDAAAGVEVADHAVAHECVYGRCFLRTLRVTIC